MRGLEIVLFLGTNLSLLILRDQNPVCWIHWVFSFSGQVERGWMIELSYNLLFWFIQLTVIQIPSSLTIVLVMWLQRTFSLKTGAQKDLGHHHRGGPRAWSLKRNQRFQGSKCSTSKEQANSEPWDGAQMAKEIAYLCARLKMRWSRWDVGESEHRRIHHRSNRKKKENATEFCSGHSLQIRSASHWVFCIFASW